MLRLSRPFTAKSSPLRAVAAQGFVVRRISTTRRVALPQQSLTAEEKARLAAELSRVRTDLDESSAKAAEAADAMTPPRPKAAPRLAPAALDLGTVEAMDSIRARG